LLLVVGLNVLVHLYLRWRFRNLILAKATAFRVPCFSKPKIRSELNGTIDFQSVGDRLYRRTGSPSHSKILL
jgi:hypothetical protein